MLIARKQGNLPLSLARSLSHYACSSSHGGESAASFEDVVQTRCKSGTLNPDEARRLFNSMLETRPVPSIRAFNQLLGALAKRSSHREVISMYREMMGVAGCGELRSDISTMNIAIHCLCQLAKTATALSVLATALKCGLRRNARTLSPLLHALCKEGSIDTATLLFEEMAEEDERNAVAHATLINGLCKAGQTLRAREILRRMCVPPIAGCFNPILDKLCKDGRVDEALTVFRDMIARGVPGDVVSYTSLIHGLSQADRSEEAKRFLTDMVGCGISPDVHTYSALIHSLCKEGKSQEAVSVLELMARKGIQPNVVTYTSLLSGLCRAGLWEEATELLEAMNESGVSPNIVTFNTVLDARCKEGSTEEAVDLAEAITGKGVVFPDILVRGLRVRGEVEEANVVTVNIILSALSEKGMIEKAEELFEAMMERGRELNTVSFNSLMKGYCLQGEMDRAEGLFNTMAVSGALPNTISYNIVVGGYVRIKRFDLALAVMKEMIHNGLMPNRVTRNILKDIRDCRLHSIHEER